MTFASPLISTDKLKEELGMKPFPANPVDQHARFIDAFCADLADMKYRCSGTTPRADRVAEIARQTRGRK